MRRRSSLRKPIDPNPSSKPKHLKYPVPASIEAGAEPMLLTHSLDQVKVTVLDYLVDAYIPLGQLMLIAGDGGQGKSTLTLDLAACLTTGRPCFGLKYTPPPPSDVLLVSCEDDEGDTLVPRLIAAGADLSRIHKVEQTIGMNGKPVSFNLSHFQAMKNKFGQNPKIKFTIIDPAGAYLGGIDDHKEAQLRELLEPMRDVAKEKGVTIKLVKHFSKGTANPSGKVIQAAYRVAGSVAYVNAVRAAFVVVPDPADKELKHFMCIKMNCGPKPKSLSYRLGLPDESERQNLLASPEFSHLSAADRAKVWKQLGRITWTGETELEADAVMNSGDRLPPKVQRCADFIQEFVKDYAYPSNEILAAANAAGFTEDNFKEAKSSLAKKGILVSKHRGKAWWTGLGDPRDWKDRPEPLNGE